MIDAMLGLLSLQLWTSSVAEVLAGAELLLLFFFASTNISTEKLEVLALPAVSLAASGVQSVATLLETLSITCDVLLAVDFDLYHEGNRSVAGLGSLELLPTWLRTINAGSVFM